MEKQEVLSTITQLSSHHLITRDELLQAFDKGKEKKTGLLRKELGVSEVLYFIGSFIVFIGISILIAQNWSSLNTAIRILITFGVGILSYVTGVVLNKEEKYGAIGFAFHLMAALLLPLGINVILHEAGYDYSGNGAQSFITGSVFLLYLASTYFFKKSFFTFFSILYATWFFFCITSLLVQNTTFATDMHFFEYKVLIVGVSYLFLGYYFFLTERKDLIGALYGFGIFFTLGAALALGGWKPSQTIFWEMIFPLLVTGTLLLSVKLKSKSFLTFGTLYLMAYIFKITSEYFSGTLGWPVSLVFCGIMLIGIGYYAFTINKKYLSPS